MPLLAPELADAHLGGLLAEFERTSAPVDVCFRDLIPAPTARDRARHDLHPYPARLLVNIPTFFLSTSLTKPGDLVVDPFCGSGTVLLEAVQAGRDAVGADANPLAHLIARVKVGSINEKHVKRALARLSEPAKEPQGDFPDVVNLEYWFYPHVRSSLVSLLRRIERIREDSTRDILRLAFSASVKEVSLADPRLSVPVRLRRDQYPSGHWLHQKTNARLARLRHIDVNKVFLQKASGIVSRLSNCALHRTARLRGIDVDARKLSIAGDSEADLVLTSPPYLGAQKYIRASSLSLTWLGMCSAKNLRDLEDNNIGREHYPKDSYQAPLTTGVHEADQLIARVHQSDPLRAHIAASYLIEMRDSINECARILRRGGHFILVAGASTLRGTRFPTPEYLTEIAESSGFHLRLHLIDKIRSRSLMTKRHPTAGSIDCESILVFRRKD